MNFRDAKQDSNESKYISKKVMINGQFVTLYSANGQTWVSSPEDLPALMDRLENARVTLNAAEKVSEGETAKVAAPEGKGKKVGVEVPERAIATKYRIKGPKPRPILRQDGVVVKGTPVEPISASSAVMSFSSDVKQPEGKKGGARDEGSAKLGKGTSAKLIAPVAVKIPTKAEVRAAAAAAKVLAKATTKNVKNIPNKSAAGKGQQLTSSNKKSDLTKQPAKGVVTKVGAVAKKATPKKIVTTSIAKSKMTPAGVSTSKRAGGTAKVRDKKAKKTQRPYEKTKTSKRR